jgi:uncharacterized protein with HEPN domain
MKRELVLYLDDILKSIDKIVEYTNSITKEEFEDNEMIQDAVVLKLQIIGESTKYIADEIRQKYPEIEWRKIVALRNLIAHEYFFIDAGLIWELIKNKLSILQDVISEIKSGIIY